MLPIIESLQQQYGDKVAFVTRHLTLNIHDYARPAAIAVEAAAEQGYFWEMVTELFEQRSEWVYVNNENLLNQRLTKIFMDTSDNKGDKGKFMTDLSSEKLGNRVDADVKIARDDGLNSTPSIIIDGTYIDFAGGKESSLTIFTEALDAALAK
jgi:protein-disulfide isomerase